VRGGEERREKKRERGLSLGVTYCVRGLSAEWKCAAASSHRMGGSEDMRFANFITLSESEKMGRGRGRESGEEGFC